MKVSPGQMTAFTSGKAIFLQLDKMMSKNETINSVLLGPQTTRDLFTSVFPDLVESNNIGKITSELWSHWKAGNNDVTLEEDDEEPRSDLDDHGKDVYVGGPAALFSAALQARSGQDAGRVFYTRKVQQGVSKATNVHYLIAKLHNRPSNSIPFRRDQFVDKGSFGYQASWFYVIGIFGKTILHLEKHVPARECKPTGEEPCPERETTWSQTSTPPIYLKLEF